MEPMNNLDHPTQVEAFKTLLYKCMTLGSNDDLLIIHDESLDPFLESFEEAIEYNSIASTLIYLPKRQQRFLMEDSRSHRSPDKIDLPSGIVGAINACTAIVNILDGAPDNASVRKAVNHTPRPNKCKLATIPGVTTMVLKAILEAPIDEILAASEEIAWILGETKEVEITTTDSLSREYRLNLNLGGWENEPIMSPGVLLPGSWGNVPPGETFCCPPFKTVNGHICINGSVRGHVLNPGEEIVLEFIEGKLISWKATNDQANSPALTFLQQHKLRALSNGDHNWNTFAELGIGLNPRITELTGNPLFDEKAIQTIHVAIGDNSVFGDDISSAIHEDMITGQPSLRVDGQLVMTRGIIDRRLIQHRRLHALETTEHVALDTSMLYLREGRIGVHNGLLMRRLTKAQRTNYVQMVPPNMNAALVDLCDAVRLYDSFDVTSFVRNYPTLGGVATVTLLDLLYHYRVLGISTYAGRPEN